LTFGVLRLVLPRESHFAGSLSRGLRQNKAGLCRKCNPKLDLHILRAEVLHLFQERLRNGPKLGCRLLERHHGLGGDLAGTSRWHGPGLQLIHLDDDASPAFERKSYKLLSYLGLIVNVIVFWNTIYMDAALRQLRKEGFEVREEDVARLSPLGHEHINMLGRYAFSLPEKIARGELRPLRNPALLDEAA